MLFPYHLVRKYVIHKTSILAGASSNIVRYILIAQYQHKYASVDICGVTKAGVLFSTSFVLLESNVLVWAISGFSSPKSGSLQITGIFFKHRRLVFCLMCIVGVADHYIPWFYVPVDHNILVEIWKTLSYIMKFRVPGKM